MKRNILIAAVCLVATNAFAQMPDSNRVTGRTARIGLEAGLNLPSYRFLGTNSDNYDPKTTTSFHVTAYGDFGINNGLLIRPGVSLQGKGTKADVSSAAGNYKLEHNVLSIDVPVNLVGRLPIGQEGAFQFLVGPYLGFVISGKEKITASNLAAVPNAERDLTIGDDAGNDLTSIDYGANGGLAYRATEGITLGANYLYGMRNIFKNNASGLKAYNRGLSFSVGFAL